MHDRERTFFNLEQMCAVYFVINSKIQVQSVLSNKVSLVNQCKNMREVKGITRDLMLLAIIRVDPCIYHDEDVPNQISKMFFTKDAILILTFFFCQVRIIACNQQNNLLQRIHNLPFLVSC